MPGRKELVRNKVTDSKKGERVKNYANITNPSLGDVYQALEMEGIDTEKELDELIADRSLSPTLYHAIEYVRECARE